MTRSAFFSGCSQSKRRKVLRKRYDVEGALKKRADNQSVSVALMMVAITYANSSSTGFGMIPA